MTLKLVQCFSVFNKLSLILSEDCCPFLKRGQAILQSSLSSHLHYCQVVKSPHMVKIWYIIMMQYDMLGCETS